MNGKELDSSGDNEYIYLSSRQAVHDIAEFVTSSEALQHFNINGNSNNNVRWIWTLICEKSFINDAEKVKASIESTLAFYGGCDLTPGDDQSSNLDGHTRLIFVNGDVDPWSQLSFFLERGSSSDVLRIKVPGASHHFWTHPVKEADGIHIVEARKVIYRHVYAWLGVIAANSPRHYDLKTE